MRTYLAAFLIAALATAALTPIVRRLALRLDAVSATGGRHMHARRIPRLGGIAIAVGLFLPILSLFFVNGAVAEHMKQNAVRVFGMCGGGALVGTVGALDDVRGMRALHKLFVQLAVSALAWQCGFRIDAVSLPIVGELSMGVFGLPVTVLWIVGVTNAVNLIDGLDGLAGGVVFFAGVTNLVVSITLGRDFTALVMSAMLGAVFAFLFYNFNPARIFMGDSGSYLLGYVLATASLVGPTGKATTAVSLLVPIVAMGLPIFDTLFAMVRRALERRPIFSPDRGHIHHRLVDLGLTHRRAVLILYGVSVVLTVASIGIYLGRSWQVGVALLTATVMMLGLVRFVGYFSYSIFAGRQRARMRGSDVESLRRAMPQLITALSRASSEADVLASLESFSSAAELASFSLRRVDGGERAEPILSWTDRRSDARRVVATMAYPIGKDSLARTALEVSMSNEHEEDQMPPQAEILLQLVVDLVAARLEDLGSELGPRVVPSARPLRSEARDSAPISNRPAIESGLEP